MPTVLVVDDSAMDRRLAGGLLERMPDWKVIYAADGREALSQLELHVPDIVVTDLQMPVLNGLELVAAVKKDYPLVPVVLMTAQGSEEIAVRALKDGAANYVPKKLLADELIEVIERTLVASGSRRTHSRLWNRMARNAAAFVLENDLTLIPAIVQFVQQTVTRMRLCEEMETLRLGVALEEALLNAYYHGNLEVSSELREADHRAYYELAKRRSRESPYRDRRIFVEVRFAPPEAEYVVRDEGPGFDPSQIPDATDPANLERPSGRGLLLMQTFMDEVRFNETGNEVTMIKRYPRKGIQPALKEVS